MACDTVRNRIVLFGGQVTYASSEQYLGDTWEWDGVSWLQKFPLQSPAPRSGSAMCFDTARGKVLLYGGQTQSGGAGYQQDTWEWDGLTWTARTPLVNADARPGSRLTYDEGRGVAVLFGGQVFNASNGRTWEWDGTTWTLRNPATKPSGRGTFGMAYDAARRVTVMFGGLQTENLTWEWDGVDWVSRPGATAFGRFGCTMTYDRSRSRSVLFGGVINFGTIYLSDVHEYEGGVNWTVRGFNPYPFPRAAMALAYLPSRRSILLFGGYNSTVTPANFGDTWEYVTNHPADFAAFGTGCAGSAGIPALAPDSGALPWLGYTFQAQLTNLGTSPQQNLPFVLLGDSKSLWGNAPLPFDLGSAGMPGCSIYTNPLITFPLLNSGGTAAWSLPLPLVPSLAGASLYAQGGVTSPGTNPLGIVLSNAGTLVLGEK